MILSIQNRNGKAPHTFKNPGSRNLDPVFWRDCNFGSQAEPWFHCLYFRCSTASLEIDLAKGHKETTLNAKHWYLTSHLPHKRSRWALWDLAELATESGSQVCSPNGQENQSTRTFIMTQGQWTAWLAFHLAAASAWRHYTSQIAREKDRSGTIQGWAHHQLLPPSNKKIKSLTSRLYVYVKALSWGWHHLALMLFEFKTLHVICESSCWNMLLCKQGVVGQLESGYPVDCRQLVKIIRQGNQLLLRVHHQAQVIFKPER